jgi:hypothetical protein
MDYLKPLKNLIADKREYLVNRSTLANILSGLIYKVDKIDATVASKQDRLVAGNGMNIAGNTVSLNTSDSLSPLLLMGA